MQSYQVWREFRKMFGIDVFVHFDFLGF
jgi:hypothetical protein